MCEKRRPWYTVEGLSTSYQANPGKRICKKKKKKSFNEQNNKAASRGRLVGKIQLRVILLQGTTFHLVNRLVDKGAVDNVRSPKKK